MKPLIIILFLSLFIQPLQAASPTYSPTEAKLHVGEHAYVVGKVTAVKESKGGNTFVNFGPSYPNQDFTVMIPKRARHNFGDISDLKGKLVKAQATIRSYRGKPEMIILHPAFIYAIED